jgi:hypothetical protein
MTLPLEHAWVGHGLPSYIPVSDQVKVTRVAASGAIS